jgi:flagellar biosynthesis chaperone FliJ
MLHSTRTMGLFLMPQGLSTLLSLQCKHRMSTKMTWANSSSQFLNEEVEHEAKLFAESLKSYELDVPKKYKTGVKIDQLHSIQDVVRQIDSAIKDYKLDSEKTVWQAFRKCFWRLSESKGLENWLGLLPSSSDYCSLICGGLSLIIKVVSSWSTVYGN